MVVATIEATVVDVVATDSVVALAAVVGSFVEVVASFPASLQNAGQLKIRS